MSLHKCLSSRAGTVSEVLDITRNICMVFNIIMIDQFRLWDKHSEGTVTQDQCKRLISSMRCFSELTQRDLVHFLRDPCLSLCACHHRYPSAMTPNPVP